MNEPTAEHRLRAMELAHAAVAAHIDGQTDQMSAAVAEMTRSHEAALAAVLSLLDVCGTLTETVGVLSGRSARDTWAGYAADWTARAAAGGFPWQQEEEARP